jgi:RecA/RadA recombinase
MGGGFPWGKNTNIVGDRSAGKTILTCDILVKAKTKYGKKLKHEYDDAENGFSFPIEVTGGVHIRDQEDYRSDTVEELKDNMAKRIDELGDNEKLIYVVDTVEGLASEEELNLEEVNRKLRAKGEETKGSYKGQKAAHMNELLKRKDLQQPNVMPIFVSQTRDKIGISFGSVKTRHCEKALEYYCAIILYLRVAKELFKTIDSKKYQIGAIIEIAIKKNKVIGSRFKPLIIMRDGIGIDEVDTNVCFLFDLINGKFEIKEQLKGTGTDSKGKPKGIEFNKVEFKSRTKLIEYIEENDLEPELERLVTEKWAGIMAKLAPSGRKHSYIKQ